VVSADYDSLLAKVIAHGATRAEAAARLRRSLRTTLIAGVRTNVDAMATILGEPDFLAGDTPTSYLDAHPDVVVGPDHTTTDQRVLLIAAVLAVDAHDRERDEVLGFAPSGWRNLRTMGQRHVWQLEGDGTEHQVETEPGPDGAVTVRIGAWPTPTADGTLAPDDRIVVAARLLDRQPGRLSLEVDGLRTVVDTRIVAGGDRRFVADGEIVHVTSRVAAASWRRAPRFVVHDLEQAGAGPVSPLPGTVIAVHVAAGDEVAEGQVLMVVEAMKMEHKITAHGAAIVTDVRFGVGDRVDTGDLLVALDERSE
jgi:propionyl-CoA carboxylase alpha chain